MLSHLIAQVGYAVALDDFGVMEEQRGFAVVPEIADAGAEYDRYQIDPHFVDQSGLECLSGKVAGCMETSLSPAKACASASALSTPSVTKVNGASR